MIILDTFPTTSEFYTTYWNKKPFLVRGHVPASIFEDVVDGDILAGLALEEDVKSRIVTTASEGGKWACDHGPFDGDHFSTLGEENWALLVQNVEQYHPETARILEAFSFAPRWLMDDIMVSYSAAGGSVGPHTDSYHVFLVQGIGRRTWTVGDAPITNEKCIEGLDLKVLSDGVQGTPVDVEMGDLIYIPPHFGHEGSTIETAMTFSIGFLGPKMSELFVEYGYYLEQDEAHNKRYSGQNLNEKSSGFLINDDAKKDIVTGFTDALNADHFSSWITEYFSSPTHVENVEPREDLSMTDDILNRLKDGDVLYRPEHVKLTMIQCESGVLSLAVFGQTIPTNAEHTPLIEWLNTHNEIAISDIQSWDAQGAIMDVVTDLYNRNALSFDGDELEL